MRRSTSEVGGVSETNRTASLVDDPPRGGGVPGQVGQVRPDDSHPVRGRAVRVRPGAHRERSDVPVLGAVEELARGAVDRQPRQRQGALLDVGLGVVADADGVELEQLTTEVLVDPPRPGAVGVEVAQHRRVRRRRDQQVREPAQRVLPDHGVVVVPAQVHAVAPERDVEVVRPEVDHLLEQLALGPDRPRDGVLHQRVQVVPGPDRARRGVRLPDGLTQPRPRRSHRVDLRVGQRRGAQLRRTATSRPRPARPPRARPGWARRWRGAAAGRRPARPSRATTGAAGPSRSRRRRAQACPRDRPPAASA